MVVWCILRGTEPQGNNAHKRRTGRDLVTETHVNLGSVCSDCFLTRNCGWRLGGWGGELENPGRENQPTACGTWELEQSACSLICFSAVVLRRFSHEWSKNRAQNTFFISASVKYYSSFKAKRRNQDTLTEIKWNL